MAARVVPDARGWIVASLGATALAGCTLGVVDLGPDPSPARMFVRSEVVPHAELVGGVLVSIHAELDPGIGVSGERRGIVSGALSVDGLPLQASVTTSAGYLSWEALAAHDAPGPTAVALAFPWIEELPPPSSINMRVQIPVTPDDTVALAEGQDLVLVADPPTNPFQNLEAMEWQLELRSPSQPSFVAVTGGRGGWPQEMRIAADRLVAAPFPLLARFRLQWRRSIVLFDLTPVDRLDLTLESDMRTEWTIVRPSPTP